MTSLRGVTRARDQSSVSSRRQRFSKLGPKQNEKCSALEEDFNDKQAAEYQSERKAFNSAKHARSLPGKTIEAV